MRQSTHLQLLTAKKEIQQLKMNMEIMKGFTIQQCLDMAEIALNLEFNFGPVYNERFEKRFRQVFLDYAAMCVADGKDDEEIIYTKEKVDRALRVARGDILPFEERYEIDNLYLRDRDLKKVEE